MRGEVLVDLGYITDEKIARCLAQQIELPFFKLDEFFRIGPEEVRLVPEALARRFILIPAKGVDDKSITVVMSDPVDIEAVDAVRSISNRDVYKAAGVEREIVAMIDKFYREEAHIERNLQDLVDEESAATLELSEDPGMDHDELRTIANDAPVVRFVNLLLMQAVRDRASEIHFEPGERDVAVRIRVDGKLREVTPPLRPARTAARSWRFGMPRPVLRRSRRSRRRFGCPSRISVSVSDPTAPGR